LKPYDFPDAKGHFGPYGGVFAAETLMQAIEELRLSYEKYRNDPDFVAASTTSVPKDRAAINLFLWGKKNGLVAVPGGYSEISKPI
jgi:hypothetical protein